MELTNIQSMIYEVRGVRVMLDFDLARLYQVETRVLKQAVRRNIDRFPDDFMLRLTKDETNTLISIGVSQNVIPPGYNTGGSETFAFTEEGVAMLATVLRSGVAVQMSIAIMRAFVDMRNYIMSTSHLTAELAEIRTRIELLERNDEENLEAVNDLSEDVSRELDNIYQAIAELSVRHSSQTDTPRRKIGYKTETNG